MKEVDNKVKTENRLVRLIKFKRAVRECIQNGADNAEMQKIANEHGFSFAKPI